MEHRSSAEINDIIHKRREQFKFVRMVRVDNNTVTIEVKGGVPETYTITDAASRDRCEWKTAE